MVHLTYRKGHESVILLQGPIGVQKMVRVEGVWFLEVMWIIESRVQYGKYFSALREKHKIRNNAFLTSIHKAEL